MNNIDSKFKETQNNASPIGLLTQTAPIMLAMQKYGVSYEDISQRIINKLFYNIHKNLKKAECYSYRIESYYKNNSFFDGFYCGNNVAYNLIIVTNEDRTEAKMQFDKEWMELWKEYIKKNFNNLWQNMNKQYGTNYKNCVKSHYFENYDEARLSYFQAAIDIENLFGNISKQDFENDFCKFLKKRINYGLLLIEICQEIITITWRNNMCGQFRIDEEYLKYFSKYCW